MSNFDRILLATKGLPAQFTAEQLVVAAWKAWPDVFGLREFRKEYPDSNAVLCNLYGKLRLVDRGWLRKTGLGLYAVTALGRSRRETLDGESRRTA